MPSQEARVHTLVDFPCLAKIHESLEDGKTRIIAYISVLARDTDEVLSPLWSELSGKCFRSHCLGVHDDNNMMMGRARLRVFELMPFCSTGPHNCALEVRV